MRPVCVLCLGSLVLTACATTGGGHSSGAVPVRGAGDTKVRAESAQDREAADTIATYLRSELAGYTEKEGSDVSLKALDAVIAKLPSVGYLYYERAERFAQLQRLDEALTDLDRALSIDTDLIPARLLRARILSAQAKLPEAVAELEALRRRAPKEVETYPLLARVHIQMRRFANAEQTLKQLLAIDPDSVAAYYYLGVLYGNYMKQYARAEAMYLKILDLQPDNTQITATLAQLYLDQKKPRQALERLLEIERRTPEDPGLELRIAVLYYELKEYPHAIRRFKAVLAKHPEADKLQYYLGVIHEESGDLPAAEGYYRKLAPTSAFYKDAWLRMAVYYHQRQKDDAVAVRLLDEAIANKRDVQEFYEYQAYVYEAKKDFAGAAKVLEAAVRQFPEQERLWFSLGATYEKLKARDKAVATMREVLQRNPRNATALNYIGYTYAERGDHLDEAEAMLQTAAGLRPNDGYILDSLAWLYFQKGDNTRALDLLRRAAQLAPNESTIVYHLGAVYAKIGEKARATGYARRAWQLLRGKNEADEEELAKVQALLRELGVPE